MSTLTAAILRACNEMNNLMRGRIMKYITAIIAAVLLSACDAGLDVNFPDGVSYTVTPLYEYYPATLNGAEAHYVAEFYSCTDGLLSQLSAPDGVDPALYDYAVYSDDGSQVVCNPVTAWRTDAEQTDVPVFKA